MANLLEMSPRDPMTLVGLKPQSWVSINVEFAMDSFIRKLTEIDWSPITQNNACQDTYPMFHTIFIK